MVFSLTSIGRLLDNWKYSYYLELCRLALGCGLARILVLKGGAKFERLQKIVDRIAIGSAAYVVIAGLISSRRGNGSGTGDKAVDRASTMEKAENSSVSR